MLVSVFHRAHDCTLPNSTDLRPTKISPSTRLNGKLVRLSSAQQTSLEYTQSEPRHHLGALSTFAKKKICTRAVVINRMSTHQELTTALSVTQICTSMCAKMEGKA
jgi:hypothetical protein